MHSADKNPFKFYQSLDPKFDSRIIDKTNNYDDIRNHICRAGFTLILGTRFSGRTTLIKSMIAELNQSRVRIIVFIETSDIKISSEDVFFESIKQILTARIKKNTKSTKNSDNTGDLFSFISNYIKTVSKELIIFFDDIEQYPPNLLVRLGEVVAALYNYQIDKTEQRKGRLSINFAGSINLTVLSANYEPTLSPFNVCKSFVLPDFDRVKTKRYLEKVINEYSLKFYDSAIELICKSCDGNLNMVNLLASRSLEKAKGKTVSDEIVNLTLDDIILDALNGTEKSLKLTAVNLEDNPSSFKLYLQLIQDQEAIYKPKEFDISLINAFEVSPPELIGAFKFIKRKGCGDVLVIRDQITKRFLEKYFDLNRIIKVLSAQGNFDDALIYCKKALNIFYDKFIQPSYFFSDENLQNVLITLNYLTFSSDSYEASYKTFSFVLENAFRCTKSTYFDYVTNKKQIKAVRFLGEYFDNDGETVYAVEPGNVNISEIRALLTKSHTVINNGDGRLKVSIPLLNIKREATGVINIYPNWQYDDLFELEYKIRTVQRTLTVINIAFNKVEIDSKNQIISTAEALNKNKKIETFVAHKFNTELLNNFREQLGRVTNSFSFILLDESNARGLINDQIKKNIKNCNLSVFEISHNNNNVYYELGLAIGLNIPILMFKRQSSEILLPDILDGLFIIIYSSYSGLLDKLNAHVNKLTELSISKNNTGIFAPFNIALPKVRAQKKFIVVADHNHLGDLEDYRTELKQIYGTGYDIIFALDEDINYLEYIFTSKYDNFRILQLYFLVKYSQKFICRCEKIEDSHTPNQCFVLLGIAHGLPNKKILMTARAYDIFDKAIDIPSDLGGLDVKRYHDNKGLRFLLSRA